MKYVIERMNDETREWWDGDGWSDVDMDAEWYETEIEAEHAAADVGGRAVGYDVD